ncbi:PHP domain-containing protein [Clostridium aestuarii]|uniref:PHP domain-containing protein n=1 Tax=Clostridium aestuarii TaxID=338193 RepID=A0ABT4D1R4_9CLOT|nr:PHP domain-containing protein [Clostridium aestuarii]MCY6485186.1 PHP domain-containing protein [Clostridium aestuarii]
MMLNEDSRVDLHIHTTASDGSYEPERIIKEAKKKDIQLIAITDHDEVANVELTKSIAKKYDIAYLPGIEVSSTLEGELFHILAYGTDNTNKELIQLLEHNKYLLQKKDDDSIRYLIEKGYNIDYLEYEKYEYDKKRGGWKALNFLIDEGLCKDVGDYFSTLFCEKNGIQFPEFNHTKEVIDIIKRANGIPVLAHPYYEGYDIPVRQKLDKFLKLGIEGIECFHPNHSDEITDRCIQWCRENGVISTAGSDFHGDFIEQRKMGFPKTTIKDINLGILMKYIY